MKKRRAEYRHAERRHAAWNYFEDLGKPMVRCKLCEKIISSNLARHLKSVHLDAYKQMQIQNEKLIAAKRHSESVIRNEQIDDFQYIAVGENADSCNLIVIEAAEEINEEVVHEEVVITQNDELPETITYFVDASKVNDEEADINKGGPKTKDDDSSQDHEVIKERHMTQKHPDVLTQAQRTGAPETIYLAETSIENMDIFLDENDEQSAVSKNVSTAEENTDTCNIIVIESQEDGVVHAIVQGPDDEFSGTVEYLDESGELSDSSVDEEITKSTDEKKTKRYPERRSKYWKYFDDVGHPYVRCKLCKLTIHANKIRHLAVRHPKILLKMKGLESESLQKTNPDEAENSPEPDGTSKKRYLKYTTRATNTFCRCNKCHKLIKLCNIKRHFLRKHPGLIKDKTDSEDNEDNEEVTENLEDMSNLNKNDTQEMRRSEVLQGRKSSEEKTSKLSVSNKRFAWVTNYATYVSPDSHECDVCKQVINTQGGIIKTMAHHFRIRHPYIVATEKSSEKALKNTLSSDDRPKSWVREYLTELGENEYRCNVCNIVLHLRLMVNMRKHFKSKHTDIFEKEEKKRYNLYKNDTQDVTRRRTMAHDHNRFENGHKKSWVRHYITELGGMLHRCHICKKILRVHPAFMGNMRRHFKSQHTAIFEKEEKRWKGCEWTTKRHIVNRHPNLIKINVQEEEKTNTEDDIDDQGVTETLEDLEDSSNLNKNDTQEVRHATRTRSEVVLVTHDHDCSEDGPRISWVRHYITELGGRLHRCNICNKILRVHPRYMGNMRRHFKSQHTDLFEKEEKRVCCRQKV